MGDENYDDNPIETVFHRHDRNKSGYLELEEAPHVCAKHGKVGRRVPAVWRLLAAPCGSGATHGPPVLLHPQPL